MLQNVFYFQLNMSIVSAAIILLILVARLILGRITSRTALYYLWGIAIFRLLVPVSLPSPLSLMNYVGDFIRSVVFHNSTGPLPNVSTLNTIKEVRRYFPMEYRTRTLEVFFKTSGLVWIIVSLLMILTCTLLYIITIWHIKKNSFLRDNSILKPYLHKLKIDKNVLLYESSHISTPVVLGIINPKIVVPPGIEDSLKYVFIHELVHIKYHDNLIRLISLISVCLHWFNPLAWIFLHVSGKDMELACDTRVLRIIGTDRKKNYADALTSMVSRQQPVFTSFGNLAVKERIVNIVSYKRIPAIMAAITMVLSIAIAVILVTNPTM